MFYYNKKTVVDHKSRISRIQQKSERKEEKNIKLAYTHIRCLNNTFYVFITRVKVVSSYTFTSFTAKFCELGKSTFIYGNWKITNCLVYYCFY